MAFIHTDVIAEVCSDLIEVIEVRPQEVGAEVCARVDCEFAWFVVEGFRDCPACELRELRKAAKDG